MESAGVRELRNHLSRYLRLVRAGETVLVTDRGQVVAELKPPTGDAVDFPYPELLRLSRAGRVRLGTGNSADLYPEASFRMAAGTVCELLDDR